MERSSIGRWLLIAAVVFLALSLGPKLLGGGGHAGRQPLRPEGSTVLAADKRGPEKLCDLWGPDFHAQITSRGASLKHFRLLPGKYRKGGEPIDLSTTPDQELRQQLRVDFRNIGALPAGKDWNVAADSFDWTLDRATGKRCEFSYRDDRVTLHKVLSTTGRPYEIALEANIQNTSGQPLYHAVTVHTDAWRTTKEVSAGHFRVSPLLTHVECIYQDSKAHRLLPTDFEPKKFEDQEHFGRSALNPGDWYEAPGVTALAAVSNAYFSHAIAPVSGPSAPVCQLQIEQRWNDQRYANPSDDPNSGAMYRARLAYPGKELAPGQSQSYAVLSYIGPKERSILAQAGGGEHRFSELIDLGFFSVIAKVLVAFLLKVHSVIPNWGIAIIILTVTARTLLFPLTVPSIKGMIKMRELKPELDALNAQFKDDAQRKGLAQMELYRKHNVNPLKGCLPQLASMPVWFALYTTLQTAVELYNIPFLWFPDLSAADPHYVLPFVIGATSFMQQRLMPQQGDPAQQKMMLYLMPGMFTVFMLFLPSGLGVYMFTNGVLGILQQQAVEWHVRRNVKAGKGGAPEIKVTDVTDPSKKGGAGKRGGPAKLSGNGTLLGKGKAQS